MRPLPHPLTERQRELLVAMVEEYTRTCAPVGSKYLAERTGLGVSSATVRNDLAALEASGMLTHPHTSAGRVPTEEGYRYYVAHCQPHYRLTKREEQAMRAAPAAEYRDGVKAVAKQLAELAEVCALVGFSSRDVYYTGLGNLFAQPEFRDYDFSCAISQVVDHLDETLGRLFPQATGSVEVQVLIGVQNPFAGDCSALLVGFPAHLSHLGILGLLGPLRMDYARNRALLGYAHQVLTAPRAAARA